MIPSLPMMYAMYLSDELRHERLKRKEAEDRLSFDHFDDWHGAENDDLDWSVDTQPRHRTYQARPASTQAEPTVDQSYAMFVEATRRMLNSMVERGATEQECRQFLFRQKQLADQRFPP